ncbi:MAG: ATP-binding protein [Bacteroides sp.]|nr:ATP-binding protein [Bacteroides sp.]
MKRRIINPSKYLQCLIREGEHTTQDFKFEISDAQKIAKTLSAFANTKGGKLLIGVKDNGNITGIQSDEEKYMIEAAADLYCKPKIDYTTKEIEINGKTVLIASIQESKNKPVFACSKDNKPLAYVRIKDETMLATTLHLQLWKLGSKEKGEVITYTEQEHNLLGYIKEKETLTLNQFYRKTKRRKRTAEFLLAKFIQFEVIELFYTDNKFRIKLKE